MRRLVFALLPLLAAGPAYASGVTMAMDEVRTITFPKPVTTVYVGNPAIADVNMIDTRHAFVLGKGFGTTNVVALDHAGTQVSNTHISVLVRQSSIVTLQRGPARTTLDCSASYCETTPQPGDAKDVFDATAAETGAHSSTAKAAATIAGQ